MFEKKLDTDPYLDKLQAKDPILYHELLVEMLKWPDTKQSLTRHGNTPSEILKEILIEEHKSTPYWVTGILSHPNCPPEVISQKLKNGTDDELLAICQNNTIEEAAIRTLARSEYSPIWSWICRRPDCPTDLLEELFSICERQWEEDLKRNSQQPELNNDAAIDDDFDNFFQDDFILYSQVDEHLMEAIASNPNTPQSVFKKMMSMNLKMEWMSEGCLGSTLLQNPSVTEEDKVFLSLQGFTIVDLAGQFVTSMIEHYGLPTSQAFEITRFPTKYLEALNEIGHPSSLLHPGLKYVDREYDFNSAVNGWIKHETIYRTLWPELTERDDIYFWYLRSSYDGDQFYFSIPGIEFEHEFSRGSYTYNSMSYPFVDRPWVETDETMDIEMSYENFSNRDIEELFDYSDEGEQYDLILAAILSQNSWAGEVTQWSSGGVEKKITITPQFSLTSKGEKFVCEWAESFFEDDREMKVSVFPEKALPYSWKALSSEKKEKITQVIIQGYNSKTDMKYQYAEHFLTCIALHKATPDSIIELLKSVESKIVSQALSVR